MKSSRRLEKKTEGTESCHMPIFRICSVRRDLGRRLKRMASKAAVDLRKKCAPEGKEDPFEEELINWIRNC